MTNRFDAGELELIRTSLRHTLAAHAAADVPGALLVEGWADLLDADPATSITVLAEEAGRARSSAPVLDIAVLWGAGLPADTAAATAVIVDGFVLAGAERAGHFVCITDDGIAATAADVVMLSPAGGFDPALGLSRATINGTERDPAGDRDAAAASVAAGRRALASQMVGAVDRMLADTIAYVTERHQYARPIGSFQTVKHRLADVKVAVTAARAATRTAWAHAGTPDAELLAVAAKCLAGRAQQLASTHCFQVHGGIAFTVEHGFQQWVRRGLLLDHLLGGHAQLTPELGRHLIERGSVLRVPDLDPRGGFPAGVRPVTG
jgi:hypothetical protein